MDVDDSVEAIKTILNSYFIRDNQAFLNKPTQINWSFLKYCEEIPKKKTPFGYENVQYKDYVIVYFLYLGYALVLEGNTDYKKWKERMRNKLYFLKDYPSSFCTESDLDYIIDCVWNSSIYNWTISELAYTLSPFKKRIWYSPKLLKITVAIIILAELVLCNMVSLNYVLYTISSFLIIAMIYSSIKKDSYNYAAYPILLIIYNYFSGFCLVTNDYNFINSDLYPVTVHITNAILLLADIIIFHNRHLITSYERTKNDAIIVPSRFL